MARGKRSGAGGAGPGRVTQPAVGVAWPARQAWSASVQSHGRAFRTQALRPTRRLQEAQSRRPPGTAQRTWRCRWTPWTCVSRGRRPRKRKVSLAPMGPACQPPVRLGPGVGVAVRLAAAPEGGMCLSPQPPSKDALRARSGRRLGRDLDVEVMGRAHSTAGLPARPPLPWLSLRRARAVLLRRCCPGLAVLGGDLTSGQSPADGAQKRPAAE